MKIVCISASNIPSDIANSFQTLKTCQALAESGHEIHLLVPGRIQTPWDQLATHYGLRTPFTIQWLAASSRLGRYDFAWAAVNEAGKLGADALYLRPLQAGVVGLLRKHPVLMELHGPPEGNFGPTLFRLFLRLPGKKRLLPITRGLLTILEDTYNLTLAKGEVVITPNGVDLNRYQDLPEPSEARQRLGLPKGLTAGYTGHLYPGRGMELLEALAERHPQIQFLWVGGRPTDVAAWRQRLSSHRLSNVHLTGFIPNRELPLYQAAADILLMPYERVIRGSGGGDSAAYCSPMKMFEYLATGRPIISSDLPVIHEVLNPDVAVFCPPEAVEPWAKVLSALADDPHQRIAMGANARRYAARYSWNTRAQRSLEGFVP